MHQERIEFLKSLLTTPGPSGFESRVAAVWAKEAEKFAQVDSDHYGNTYATINPNAPFKVMLAGHIDEIGIIVTYIDDDGFIYFTGVGGWDPQVLVGQRIRLMSESGDLIGVIGKKAIHKMTPEDRTKVSKIDDLWIDIGLKPEEVKQKVQIGDLGVVEQGFVDFGNGRFACKALDNRLGAFVVLEALRVLKERGCQHQVIAVATSQEEIGTLGARLATFKLDAHLGIAVDVTHAKHPGLDAKSVAGIELGSGTVIDFGPILNTKLSKGLLNTAKKHDIKVKTDVSVRSTGTDGDELALVRAGMPTAVIGIPLRYMHSPSEMADINDIQASIDLIVNYLLELPENYNFNR